MPLKEVLGRTILSKIFRTALPRVALGLCLLAGCAREDNAKSATGGSSSSVPRSAPQSASVPLARCIKGLELAMTLGQVGQVFTVKEDKHSLKEVLAKYLKPEISGKDMAIQKRHFHVSPGKAKCLKVLCRLT
jgi:hypothetical protein